MNLLLLIDFLHRHSVAPGYASRIYALWGEGAVARLQADPYELMYEVRGIGFKVADTMALKLGLAPDSPKRIQAAMVYTLFSQSERGGHLYCPRTELVAEVGKMLDYLEPDLFEQALDALAERKWVRLEELGNGEVAVYLMHFYHWENETAQRLCQLVAHPAPVSREKILAILPRVEE